jgi:hypothetical protein
VINVLLMTFLEKLNETYFMLKMSVHPTNLVKLNMTLNKSKMIFFRVEGIPISIAITEIRNVHIEEGKKRPPALDST